MRAKVQNVGEITQIRVQFLRVTWQTQSLADRVHLQHREGVFLGLGNMINVYGELVGHFREQKCAIVFVKVQELHKDLWH